MASNSRSRGSNGKMVYKEDDENIERYTLAYPDLPDHLDQLVNKQRQEVPDYTSVDLAALEDEDNSEVTSSIIAQPQSNRDDYIVKVVGEEQGVYDAELEWNADRTRSQQSSALYGKNALWRRTMISGLKGTAFGIAFGSLLSVGGRRWMTFIHTMPPSFDVYTIGGSVVLFGGMSMVRTGKRYKEYMAFKQSGISNPERIMLGDAKNQMAMWMSSNYSDAYVEQWKESEEVDETLSRQLAGIRH